ncbi:MAG: DUF177 domain-containing protein [Gemmatimonadota bacterium]|jgi:uncharacterized protein
MLKVDLGRVWREGSVAVEAQIPSDAELWADTGVEWSGPVDVRIRVSAAGTGEIVGRGRVSGTLLGECRRCLKPVRTKLDEELTLVFVTGESEADSEDAGAFSYDPGAGDLDLSEAVREEVLLAMNPYVVCDPECPGLCPKCGKNLKEGPCGCTEDESDPRWDALRELKKR